MTASFAVYSIDTGFAVAAVLSVALAVAWHQTSKRLEACRQRLRRYTHTNE